MALNRSTGLLVLGMIVVLGAVVRVLDVGSQALWTDEALTLVIAQASPWRLAWYPIDPTGPLYYWLHQLLLPASPGPALARSISVVAGVLTIAATFAVARTFLDVRSSLLAAALVALAPILIDYSQEARAYATVTLLCSLAALCLLRADAEADLRRRRLWLAGFALCSTLAIYGHLAVLPFVGAALLVLRIAADRRGALVRATEVYAVWAGVALATLVELRRVMLNIGDQSLNWLRQFSLPEFLDEMARQWLPFADSSARAMLLLIVFVAASIALVVWRSARARSLAQRHPIALLLVSGWLMQPFGLWLLGFVVSPVFMTRTAIIAWPAFALTVAALLSLLGERAWRVAAGAVVAGYALWLAATATMRPREDWRAASRLAAGLDSDVQIVCPGWKAPPLLAASEKRPILLFDRGRLLQADDGNVERWPAAFNHRVWRRWWRGRAGRAQPVSDRVLVVRRVTLVESECLGPDADAVAALIEPARLKAAWVTRIGSKGHDPALGQPAGIRVRLYEFPRPQRLVVER